MLRSIFQSSSHRSLSLLSRFIRQFPRSYLSSSSSTTAISTSGRNLRRISTPTAAGRRLFLPRGLRLLPAVNNCLSEKLSHLFVRAIATQPAPSYHSQDHEAEKLGFEKVTKQFISECKSKVVLFKHKKTGCEVMSVSDDDENKVFGSAFPRIG